MILDLRHRRARIAWQAALIIVAIPFAFPLYSMLQISFSGQGAVTNYSVVLSEPGLGNFFISSIAIALIAVVVSYICTLLAGFAFARLRVPGRNLVFSLILFALTLPTVSLTVPLFVMVTHLGLFDSYFAVALPVAALGIPLDLLVARDFISNLPDAVFEAAELDGCGVFRTFLHIVVPLTRPLAGVIVVLTFLAAWNEYLLALLFLQSPDKQPITLLPQFFVSQLGTDQTKVVASSVVIAVPIIIVYLCAQRFVERGLTAGAVK